MLHSWDIVLAIGGLACVLRLGLPSCALGLWFEDFEELFHGRHYGHSNDLMELLLVWGLGAISLVWLI